MLRRSAAVERVNAGTTTVKCPSCGYGAGIYCVPAEHRTPSTLILCLACRHEAVLEEWHGRVSRGMPSNPGRARRRQGGMI